MGGLRSLIMLTVAVWLFGGHSFAQSGEVVIITPEKDSIVRGVVEVIAEKPNPKEGTFAWKIARVGHEAEAEFQANTLAGIPFVWDTRVRDENGERYYPDGKYVITANAFDADGKLQGTASTTITIENDIPATAVGEGVNLKILLKANDTLSYAFEGTEKLGFDVHPQAEGYDYTVEIKLYDGLYGLKMLSGAGTGEGGIARQTCLGGVTYIRGMRPEYIKDVGKEFTQQYNGDGSIEPRKQDAPHFAIGECYIKLPTRTLNLDSRPWKSDLQLVLEFYTMQQYKVTAEHRLDGFEWVAGRRCARIKSTFDEKGLTFDVNLQGRPAKITGDIKGTRITYFAYEEGYPVSIEDTIEAEGEVEFKQQMAGGMPGMMMGEAGMGGMPGMMGGGMPGMMGGGMPGMMPGGIPGMAPEGGMPGMMPGTPGMMGGGMPGMMGGGMPGAMVGMPPEGGMPGMMPGMPGMMGGGMPGMMGGGMPGMMPGGMPGMAPEGGMPGMMPGMPGMMGGGMPGMMGMGQPGMAGEAGMMGAAQPQQAQKTKVKLDVTLKIALKQ